MNFGQTDKILKTCLLCEMMVGLQVIHEFFLYLNRNFKSHTLYKNDKDDVNGDNWSDKKSAILRTKNWREIVVFASAIPNQLTLRNSHRIRTKICLFKQQNSFQNQDQQIYSIQYACMV